MDLSIDQVVNLAVEARASDIHICAGIPIKLRVDGKLVSLNDRVLSEADCEEYAKMLTTQYEKIKEIGELDLSVGFPGGIRCRVNLYRERGSVSAAIRILNNNVPGMEELGLPVVINKLIELKQGLVLVTGQTGSGKSTTMAYMIDQINRTSAKHIVTFEEPIEYIHPPIQSVVNQREVGLDTRTLKDGLKAVLREDPDVILIGELRTLEEIEMALTIAETGHLVFATLHTNSAAETVDRVVDVFPAQQQTQVRMQLSMALRAVICQQLLPHICGKGRVLATEVMMMTPAIANLIREGKTPQIENCITTDLSIGSHLMDTSLIELFKKGKVSREDVLMAAHNQEFVRRSVR